MISWLKGRLIDKQDGIIVIDVGGVGYELTVSSSTLFGLPDLSDEVELTVQTIVREDAFALYGFLSQQEKKLFNILVKVNGIGPRVAMNILSNITPEALIRTVLSKDLTQLTKLPGIGKKTAERLLVEVADKLQAWLPDLKLNEAPLGDNDAEATHVASQEALQALLGLGFQRTAVEKVLRPVSDDGLSADELIRHGLRQLSAV